MKRWGHWGADFLSSPRVQKTYAIAVTRTQTNARTRAYKDTNTQTKHSYANAHRNSEKIQAESTNNKVDKATDCQTYRH